MCGIVGACGDLSEEVPLEKMILSLEHRGPDDSGMFTSPEQGVCFGHTRLAIVDLEPRSRQPMHSKCGRYTMVYNGEIYNFQEIRRDLENLGVEFQTSGDTEVLLEGFAMWRLDVLDRLNGMFAIAIWDHADRSLLLLRDRCGVKPLYYAFSRSGKGIVFASEMRALASCRSLDFSLSDKAVGEFLWLGYVRSPNTVVEQIHKLRPAHYAIWNQESGWRECRYWQAIGSPESRYRSPSEAAEELEPLLRDSFQLRLQADVPVGLLLSGGVDSAIVLGLLRQASTRTLKTFTLGFASSQKDERQRARQYSEFNQSEHYEYELGPEEYDRWRKSVPSVFDEPLGDVSAIPTCAIAQHASDEVKVLLSADGADEWFAGYRRHHWASLLSAVARCAPRAVWRGFHAASSTSIAERVSSMLGRLTGIRSAPDKLDRILSFLAGWPQLNSYLELNAVAPSGSVPDSLFADNRGGRLSARRASSSKADFLRQALEFDRRFYLADNILLKLDRATMSSSVEGRDPFLDHRVLEVAAGIPKSVLFGGKKNKPVLREVAERIYGKGAMDERKLGFGAPVLEWGQKLSGLPARINDPELRSVLGEGFDQALQNGGLPAPLVECVQLLDAWCGKWREWRAQT